jgi:RNA polymerase sigma-70 factor (sigma-E family)
MDDAFTRFVSERGPALRRYAYVLTGNSYDADDLVQEALVRLRAAWPRVRRPTDPEGYVRTTMARLHINFWRKRRRERLTVEPPERGQVDAGIEEIDNRLGLWRLVADLPPRQRTVLVLRYHDGLADSTIAEMLGISPATVRSQAMRALARLRAQWPGPGETGPGETGPGETGPGERGAGQTSPGEPTDDAATGRRTTHV